MIEYTQSQREQAARVLDILADCLQHITSTETLNALDTAISVLRSQGWVRTSNDKPKSGLVAAIEKVTSGLDNHDTLSYPVITDAELVREEPDALVYWYQLPPLPEVEHEAR